MICKISTWRDMNSANQSRQSQRKHQLSGALVSHLTVGFWWNQKTREFPDLGRKASPECIDDSSLVLAGL